MENSPNFLSPSFSVVFALGREKVVWPQDGVGEPGHVIAENPAQQYAHDGAADGPEQATGEVTDHHAALAFEVQPLIVLPGDQDDGDVKRDAENDLSSSHGSSLFAVIASRPYPK